MASERFRLAVFLLPMFPVVAWSACRTVAFAAEELPQPQPVPEMQVIPQPYDQASFQHEGQEMTRYHFGPGLRRPFCFPMRGAAGRSLTRMGHPRDPLSHSHHNSVWISHQSVGGVSFWADRGPGVGRIVHQRVEQYEDGPEGAWMLSVNAWQDADGKTVMLERRRIEVQRPTAAGWLMLIDLQFEAPAAAPVTLEQSPFGLIGVRMAKTIGVHDGGGRILNSAGQVNEAEAFRQPARWVDYSGPVAKDAAGGVTLMDHPANPRHPVPFHVRDDGWMGASLTLNEPLGVEPSKPLRLRYGLWTHPGVPRQAEIEKPWQRFAQGQLPALTKTGK